MQFSLMTKKSPFSPEADKKWIQTQYKEMYYLFIITAVDGFQTVFNCILKGPNFAAGSLIVVSLYTGNGETFVHQSVSRHLLKFKES